MEDMAREIKRKPQTGLLFYIVAMYKDAVYVIFSIAKSENTPESPTNFSGYLLASKGTNKKQEKSAFTQMIDRANKGERNDVGYYLAVDGKRYTSAIAFHKGEPPIEEN